MKKNILIISFIWTALIAGSFLWNYHSALKKQHGLALHAARSNFQQILLFRSWNSLHGGVYVPITESTQPNTYLEVALRDIKVSKELSLTMINPAFMTRQVSEIAEKKEGIKFHITSLNPIRPENRATEIEEAALKEFEKGIPEKGIIKRSGEGYSFFYMAPLITDIACLKCHIVAKTMQNSLKRPGDFCARYGGEEFIIILPATDQKGAKAIADEIRSNIMAINIPHEKSLTHKIVTISLGVATKEHGEMITHERLLKMADDALYQAKENGRNRTEVYSI